MLSGTLLPIATNIAGIAGSCCPRSARSIFARLPDKNALCYIQDVQDLQVVLLLEAGCGSRFCKEIEVWRVFEFIN
jgi:hypothetical protein